MSIRRSARRVSYTQIDNAVFAPGLSFRAMGLLAFLLSKPDHWEVSVAHLVNFSADSARPDGRDSIYSMIDELMLAGFMRRERSRGEGGKMAGYDYEVFDSPQPQPSKPDADQPCTAQPYTVKPTQVITDSEVKTEKKKELKVRAEKGQLDVILPDWLPLQEWMDFMKMRQAMGARGKLTNRAAELVVAELTKLHAAGHDPAEVLRQSVMNNWRGVFALKAARLPAGASRNQSVNDQRMAELFGAPADPMTIDMENSYAKLR